MNVDDLEMDFKQTTLDEYHSTLGQMILTIDIGVQHLSLVMASVDQDQNIQIQSIDLINITEYTHKIISQEDCTLHHTKTFFDWLRHIVQEYNSLFEQADIILLERQPPMGFVVVEQILFGFFRDKTTLISPNSVHAYHNFQNLDYEQRKVASEIIALPYLSIEQRQEIKLYDRAHDITDAILQLIYYLHKNKKEKHVPTTLINCTSTLESINYLEKFRYKKM